MELEEARALRDELAGFTRSMARGSALARTVLTETGNRFSSSSQPLTIALGISVGASERDFGLAVRTTGPRGLIESEFLPAVRERTDNVDVKVIEPIRPRLLKVGASIGHRGIDAGTLGAFVRDRATGARGILSNNHVLADTNRGQRGDAIVHPGPHDGGNAAIATLERFIPLAAENEVDAAFALLSNVPFDSNDIGGRLVLSGRQKAPTEQLEVCKLGRTTGLTRGKISAIDVADVGPLDYGTMWCTFDGQIEITSRLTNPFSAGGDSGSLVVTPTGDAVGLLFAGTTSQDGRYDLTYVNPIGRVLDLLDLDLVH